MTDDPLNAVANNLRVCRYFDLSGTGSYAAIGKPLSNQNYFVMRAGSGSPPAFDCPSGVTIAHPVT